MCLSKEVLEDFKMSLEYAYANVYRVIGDSLVSRNYNVDSVQYGLGLAKELLKISES